MSRAFVTGASGFIGRHLVPLLRARDVQVTCLVRRSSRSDTLTQLGCELVLGDVLDARSLEAAAAAGDFDQVFHLAGLTKSIRPGVLFDVNQQGTRNLLRAFANQQPPPTVVLVSSLAAAGPAPGRPREERDAVAPVSYYGKSKLAAELESQEYIERLPITIVRPPIVLGPQDRDGFELFKAIHRFGFHAMPPPKNMAVSWIHVDDVCRAIVAAAERGERRHDGELTRGIYFASADEVVDYRDLGHLIGEALGRNWVVARKMPAAAVWSVAAVNEMTSRVTGRPTIMNFDKAREAIAGSWTCSAQKLREETGFQCQRSLQETLTELVQWYRNANWL